MLAPKIILSFLAATCSSVCPAETARDYRPSIIRPVFDRPVFDKTGFENPSFERPSFMSPRIIAPVLEPRAFFSPQIEQPSIIPPVFDNQNQGQKLTTRKLENPVKPLALNKPSIHFGARKAGLTSGPQQGSPGGRVRLYRPLRQHQF